MPHSIQASEASAGSAALILQDLRCQDGNPLTLAFIRRQFELAGEEFKEVIAAQNRVYNSAQLNHRPLSEQEGRDARALEEARCMASVRRRALGALETLTLAGLPLLLTSRRLDVQP